MTAAIISLEERLALSLALRPIATGAALTEKQVRLVLLGLAGLEESVVEGLLRAAREDRQRSIDARTRREEQAEEARRRARGETGR